MSRHEPRVVLIPGAPPEASCHGACSWGCCTGSPVATITEAMADARRLIEAKENAAESERANAYWEKHTRKEATS